MLKRISSLQAFFAANGITITNSLLAHQIDPEAVKKLTASLLRGLGSALFELVMILVTVTFIFGSKQVPPGLILALGKPPVLV